MNIVRAIPAPRISAIEFVGYIMAAGTMDKLSARGWPSAAAAVAFLVIIIIFALISEGLRKSKLGGGQDE